MRPLPLSVRFEALVLLCCLGLVALAGQCAQVKHEKPPSDWLKQLKSGKVEDRVRAVWELRFRLETTWPRDEAVEAGLIEAVGDPSPAVRTVAAYALGSYISAPEAAVVALKKASKDPERSVRVAAHTALWSITKDEASWPHVTEALKDKEPHVRREAVRALAASQDEKTLAALIPFLKDSDAKVRGQAAMSFESLCRSLGGKAKQAVPALVESLSNGDPYLRWTAADALGSIGSEAKAARPALVQALQDGDDAVRAHAAQALGTIGSDGKTVVPALVQALLDQKGQVRAWAAYALGKIGAEAKPAVAALQKTTQDKLPNVRVAARLALWRTTGDEKQVGLALTEAAEDKESPVPLATPVAWLAMFGPSAVPVLVDNLKHPVARVRKEVAFSLASVQPPAKEAVPALIQALQDPDSEVRNSAADALRAIDPEAAKQAGVK